MSQITEQQTARKRWFDYRAQEYLLKRAEALGFENPAGFENPDDDDEVGLVHAWQFIMIEAEKLAPVDLERYGGEEFKSFMSQDISVLIDKYPHLLLHARMGLKRQKEDRERKEQKKRKLEESAGGSAAGGSAAGGSAGVDAMETALLQARPGPCPLMMSLTYQKRIERLVKRELDLVTAVAKWKSDFEFAQARATESSAQNEEFKQEIKKLKGQDLNLPADEMDQLIKDQELYHDRLLKLRVQRELEMRSVETVLEEDPDIVCSITGNVFEDPVVAQDGFTYERQAIEKWIRDKIYANRDNQFNPRKWNSPRTGAYFDSNVVFPNIDKKTQIFNAREEATKAREEATSEEGIQRLVEKRRRF